MSAAAKQNSAKMTTVEGRIERFLAGPKSDGFAIAKLTTRNGSLTIRARSALAEFSIGDAIKVSGQESAHPRFGRQIEATAASASDQTLDGPIRWLEQAGITGIGEKRAEAIVRTLGANAIERIRNGDPAAQKALGKSYAEARKLITDNFEAASAGVILAGYDIGKETRKKIFEIFGDQTADVINSDPYRLITSVEGIAFATADKIARAAGVSHESEARILAAAIDTLRFAANDGST